MRMSTGKELRELLVLSHFLGDFCSDTLREFLLLVLLKLGVAEAGFLVVIVFREIDLSDMHLLDESQWRRPEGIYRALPPLLNLPQNIT